MAVAGGGVIKLMDNFNDCWSGIDQKLTSLQNA